MIFTGCAPVEGLHEEERDLLGAQVGAPGRHDVLVVRGQRDAAQELAPGRLSGHEHRTATAAAQGGGARIEPKAAALLRLAVAVEARIPKERVDLPAEVDVLPDDVLPDHDFARFLRARRGGQQHGQHQRRPPFRPRGSATKGGGSHAAPAFVRRARGNQAQCTGGSEECATGRGSCPDEPRVRTPHLHSGISRRKTFRSPGVVLTRD